MMEAWRKIRLGDACKTNMDSYSTKEEWDFVNYLDTGNITDNKIDSIQHIDLKNEKLPSRARRKVKKDSIIYSMVRPNQRHFGIVKSQQQNFLVSTGFVVIDTDAQVLDADFLYYLLTQANIVEALHAIAEQSTSAYPSIKLSDIENLKIEIPTLATQKKIAAVLGSFDRKITQNTKVNKNLEQQAMTLVSEYCASTIDSIPLGEIMSFENGFAFQSKTYLSSGQYRIITIKNVQDGKIDSQGAAYINDVPSRMKPGCYLVPGDVLLSLTGNVGRAGIVSEENLLLNQRIAKVVPNDLSIIPWLYYYFRLPFTKTALETIAKGTAQQNLSPVETLKLTVPFEMLSAKELSQVLYPIFMQEITNEMEALRLANLRDTLLPKLMSGELDVSDIDL